MIQDSCECFSPAGDYSLRNEQVGKVWAAGRNCLAAFLNRFQEALPRDLGEVGVDILHDSLQPRRPCRTDLLECLSQFPVRWVRPVGKQVGGPTFERGGYFNALN